MILQACLALESNDLYLIHEPKDLTISMDNKLFFIQGLTVLSLFNSSIYRKAHIYLHISDDSAIHVIKTM